jgi:hypothetical protein
MGCDGESALGCCFDPGVFAKARSSDFDLIVAVRRRTEWCPKLQWKPERAEGHKGKELPFEELTEMQQFNVMADERAKVHL